VAPPRLDKLLEQTDSRYALVVGAAKRARQITSYRLQELGTDPFDTRVAPPLVEDKGNALSIALREIAEGKIVLHVPDED
jgi:DNA-directed RNA polymerase subunit omega